MFINKIMLITAVEEEERKYINSATAGRTGNWEYIEQQIEKAWQWIIKIVDPFALYGVSAVIVVCALIWFCSHDNKAISKGLKWFFVYVAYCFFRGQLLCP